MRTVLAVLLGLAPLGGCSLDAVTPPEQFQWHGDLEAAPGWEPLSGDAGAIWTAGSGEITVGVTTYDDEPNSIRAWHLHRNTCAEGGEVHGDESDYPPLVTDAIGQAGEVVTIRSSVHSGSRFHIDVHASEENLSAVIACADLVPLS